MSPAHRAPEHRWRVVGFVALVLVVVGVVAASGGTGSPTSPSPSVPDAQVGAPDAESSAWYCTVQSNGTGVDRGALVLTNSTGSAVGASVAAITETGSTVHAALTVAPHAVASPELPSPSSGSWVAQTVVVDGGGVAVSQVVDGPSGWATAPCLSTTSSQWYFPVGTTSGSDALDVALLNPTSTPVVADLAFVTPAGVVHPINFQGLVLDAGQLLVENVAPEVQDQSNVSTIVTTRTGWVVASEVQQVAASEKTGSGLWLVPGESSSQQEWTIPAARETPGGSSEIDVLNPGATPETVTVRLRLASGPLTPLTARVAPGSTWAVATSGQTRIPADADYSADVSARGGAGVVVGRRVSLPSSSTAPQDGAANAVGESSSSAPSHQWLVPPPGTSTAAPVSGAAPSSLSLRNTSASSETYRVMALSGGSARSVALGTLPVGVTAVISGAPLAAAGLDQIEVRADGPLAVSEDVGPSGGVGVVTMPGIPLAMPINGA